MGIINMKISQLMLLVAALSNETLAQNPCEADDSCPKVEIDPCDPRIDECPDEVELKPCDPFLEECHDKVEMKPCDPFIEECNKVGTDPCEADDSCPKKVDLT